MGSKPRPGPGPLPNTVTGCSLSAPPVSPRVPPHHPAPPRGSVPIAWRRLALLGPCVTLCRGAVLPSGPGCCHPHPWGSDPAPMLAGAHARAVGAHAGAVGATLVWWELLLEQWVLVPELCVFTPARCTPTPVRCVLQGAEAGAGHRGDSLARRSPALGAIVGVNTRSCPRSTGMGRSLLGQSL